MNVFGNLKIEDIVARVLGVPAATIHDDLGYQAIHQWDSLRHVAMMLSLEKRFGVKIDEMQRSRLRSVSDIKKFLGAVGGTASSAERRTDQSLELIYRGLEGIYFDTTSISNVDGSAGKLEFRGKSIHELANDWSFEDVALLLLSGSPPNQKEREAFREELRLSQVLPTEVSSFLASHSYLPACQALQCSVSILGALNKSRSGGEKILTSGIRLIGQIPLIIATHDAARRGLSLETDLVLDDMSYASYLYRLFGLSQQIIAGPSILNRTMVVQADHSSNAATFSLRTAASTGASLHSSVVAAICAFSGPIHGGAVEGVMLQIEEIGHPDLAQSYVDRKLDAGGRIMGFGHRVYKTEDPRVQHLRQAALDASVQAGEMLEFDITESLVRAMEPFARHGLCPNVDLYAAIIYRKLGLPDYLAAEMFVASRVVGWIAHFIEQAEHNVLIRPLLKYAPPSISPHR